MLGLNIFCSAQNFNKYYTSLSQPEGVLYHIFSIADYKNESNSSFEFDVTYVSISDSVVINYTVMSSKPLQIKKLLFEMGNDRKEAGARKLYIDNYKGQWRNRYSSTISKEEFRQIIESKASLKLLVESENETYTFNLEGKTWNNHRTILEQVFQMILLNEN